MAKKSREHDVKKTKANKIRRIEKELKRNPNNTKARESLEFWKTHDKRDKKTKRDKTI